jgi:hypothetical protein
MVPWIKNLGDQSPPGPHGGCDYGATHIFMIIACNFMITSDVSIIQFDSRIESFKEFEFFLYMFIG